MSSQFDVHIMTFPVVLTGATVIPLVHMPSGGGGITVLGAEMINAGTSVTGVLVTMTNAGTPATNGTIGSFAGTIAASATIPAACTLSDAFVDAGEWIGFDQASGTVPAGSFVTMSYIMGK
jgi:hypothetical protein